MDLFRVIFILSCSFAGSYCFSLQIGNQRHKTAALERFDNTCGERNVDMIFRYSSIKADGTKLVMNSTVTVKRDLSEDLWLAIDLERCKNKENLDTCEHFYTHKSERFCAMVGVESALWGPMYSKYKPPFICPFKKTVYRAVNSTIDVAAFLLFPADSWYWRVKIQLRERDTNNLVMCCKAEAHIVNIK